MIQKMERLTMNATRPDTDTIALTALVYIYIYNYI